MMDVFRVGRLLQIKAKVWTALATMTATLVILSGCEVGSMEVSGQAQGVEPTGETTTATTSTTRAVSAVSFSGATAADNVTGSTVRVNWADTAGAVSYNIYNSTSDTMVLVSNVTAPATNYTVTGLTAGQTYKFRVRLVDSSGLMDTNTVDVSATTVGTTPPSSLSYSTSTAVYTIGTAITTNSPTVTGSVTTYGISPSLPTGLTFNANGTITGTPTAISNAANYTVTATNAGGSTTATVNITVNFAGISTIDNVAGDGMRLNWTHVAGAAIYNIYNMTSGSPVFLATVTAPTQTYTITSLSSSTTYSYRVRMTDSGGTTDTNTHNVAQATANITATFNGWNNVKAVGPKAPAAQSSDLATSAASVTIGWNAVTPSSGVVASYNVYRSETAGTENFTSPIGTATAGTPSYTDATVVAGTTYYYNIAPVVAVTRIIPSSTTDREIKVITPPNNMVLLHRWMANLRMCTAIGKAVDRTSNYRCTTSVPGGDGTNLDYGSGTNTAIFIDTYEQGCNYTYSSSGNRCGSASGCIGIIATPNNVVTGDVNDVYYSRLNSKCFINTNGGMAWTEANSATALQLSYMGSAAAGLPPLVVIGQLQSHYACNGHIVSGFSGTKRLLYRKEWVEAASWNTSLADATIDTMENGINLDSTHNCNSNYASPQGNTTTDITGTNPSIAFDNTVYPAATNRDTLPGCRFGDCASTVSSIRSVRTGSNATSSCVSRYGAQDMPGNIWEWTSDQISCNNTTCVGITAAANTVDDNPDFGGSGLNAVNFDATQGPTTTNTFTSFGKIQLPIGIPIPSASAYGGDGVFAQTSTQFHGDYFYINVALSSRGAIAGGGWYNAAKSGRFALYLSYAPADSSTAFGSRCALPAD